VARAKRPERVWLTLLVSVKGRVLSVSFIVDHSNGLNDNWYFLRVYC